MPQDKRDGNKVLTVAKDRGDILPMEFLNQPGPEQEMEQKSHDFCRHNSRLNKSLTKKYSYGQTKPNHSLSFSHTQGIPFMLHTFYNEKLNAFFSLHQCTEGTDFRSRTVEHYTIFWVREGEVNAEVDFHPLQLTSSGIFFLSPAQHIELSDPLPADAVVLSFNRNFYCVELHDAELSCNGLLFNGALQSPRIQLDAREAHSFDLLFQVMEDEFETAEHAQMEMLQSLLKRFIIKSSRIARQQFETSNDLQSPEVDLIRSFSALVEKHFRQWRKVSDYADQLNRSPKTLSNLFKKYGSVSPSSIISERIAIEAKRLLLYTDQSVKEIAYDLGFDDPGHFSKYFHKSAGHSPSEFRTQQNG